MMFFHKAELAGYSSVVGQPIMLLNERGACIGQLSLIEYQDDDYKKAVADIADALNEITALRAQLAAAEAEKMRLTLDVIAAESQAADAIRDKLAYGERVREAAISALLSACRVAGSGYKDENERILRRAEREAVLSSARAIRALKLDALAEGEK